MTPAARRRRREQLEKEAAENFRFYGNEIGRGARSVPQSVPEVTGDDPANTTPAHDYNGHLGRRGVE